ncbi:MAG: DNA polymerase III subunit delta [Geminicoccales bacterium]
MKLGAAQIERFLRAPDPKAVAVLIYGPDDGLVRERVERLVGTVLDDPKDPFRLSELSGDGVRGDPARLVDEARALCLVGGRRVVRVRQASDQATPAVRSLLALDRIEALVVLEAGELPGGSSLRRLIEGAPTAAALPCYRDEGRGLETLIDRLLAERGLEADAEAKDHLLRNLGADRALTRMEIDKLALYMGVTGGSAPSARRLALDDVLAMVGDGAALEIDDLVHAAALGDAVALERCLNRLLGEGQAPVRLARSLANHMARLHRLALQAERDGSIDRVVDQQRPPIHFRRKDSFKAELRRWSPAAAAIALERLLEAEIACKTTGFPAALLCREAALALCRDAMRPT